MTQTRIAAVITMMTLTACTVLAGCASPASVLRTATALRTAPVLKARASTAAPAVVRGMDVSSFEPTINWESVKTDGAKFAYIKSTEGTYFHSPAFPKQYAGARAVGIVAGAYHFAIPDSSGGTAQADYFAKHGGAYKAGTLPGVLDIEDNPYGAKCYGLSHAAMTSWIRAFVVEYHKRTGWWPVINTFTAWWKACTGNTSAFAAADPLWVNNRHSSAGVLPAGWRYYTVWQWAVHGVFPGDQDVVPGKLFTELLAERG
jgi:GH25 family lysozyme M1 (1,4-beta-N-acetylmuramidase)